MNEKQTAGEYVSFQKYAHDPYLGRSKEFENPVPSAYSNPSESLGITIGANLRTRLENLGIILQDAEETKDREGAD